MSYQSQIANMKRLKRTFYRTASNIATAALYFPFAVSIAPSLAVAADRAALPTVEIHFEVLDNLVSPEPFEIESKSTSKSLPKSQANSPFPAAPSKPLEIESPKGKPVAKPAQDKAKIVEKKVPEKASAEVVKSADTAVSPKQEKPKTKTNKIPPGDRPASSVYKIAPQEKPQPVVSAPVEKPKTVTPKVIPAPVVPAPVATPKGLPELVVPKSPELPVAPKVDVPSLPEAIDVPKVPVMPQIDPLPAPTPAPVAPGALDVPKAPVMPAIPTDEPKVVMPQIDPLPAPTPAPVAPGALDVPKAPVMPAIPTEEPKVAPKVEPSPDVQGKSTAPLITPMPPAPTPNDEFARALNEPNTAIAPPPPAPPASPVVPAEPVVAPKAPEPPAALPVPPASEAKPAPVEPKKEETVKAAPKNDKVLLSIKFISTETDLPLAVEEDLKKVASRIKTSNERVSLVAYASESADQATMARRVSLSRVLAVRAFLIEQGVDKLRMNVQAEGSKADGGEPNRVDILLNDSK